MKFTIYIKIGPRKIRPPGGSPVRQTRAKSYSRGTRKRNDKQRGKDPECFEDERSTLPSIKKPIYLISPLIVPKNHPTVREDNPTLPSLRDRQVPEFHGIRENITRLDLPRYKTKPMSTETINSAPGECHDNDKEPCWQRKDLDQTTRTISRSSPLRLGTG